MFDAIARGEIKALWVMATNPAVSLPRAGAVREALKRARSVRRVRERAIERHRRGRRACAAAGRRLGREGRHRHQFGAPHLAPARVPAAARRGQARLVDRRRRSRARMGFARGLRLSLGRRHLPRACGAVGLRERRQRAISTSAASHDLERRGLRRARSGAMAGACRRGRAHTRFFADGGFFTPDRQGALRRARAAGAASPRSTPRFPFRLNTGRVRDQWHTMTRSGAEPAARRPLPGAFRRRASGRRRGRRPRRRRICPRDDAPWRLRAQGRVRCGPAARLAVRADPLERRHRHGGTRVRSRRRRTPIPFPASPKPRRRRQRLRRSRSPSAGSR